MMGTWKVLFCVIVTMSGADMQREACPHEDAAARSAPGVVWIQGQGFVRGTRARDGPYFQFKGIPYANSSQENRFKNRLPVPKWMGIREVNTDVPCAQLSPITGEVVATEDCLVVNVYTPQIRRGGRRLAVMVFVHGGGNNQGSAESFIYGPKRFMEEGVILVTFNYRLGILGFLCTGDIANAGLKDAIAALEWVKLNIAAFGGDPENVTLFGESSGSVMVEILVLSKRATSLFKGAILQSGMSTSPWAFGSDPEKKVRRIAEQLGYTGEDKEARMRVLKNAALKDLIETEKKLVLNTPFEFIPITPCIEPATNPGAVITEDPISAINSYHYNDVPLMLGFNKDEGMLLYPTVQEYPNFFEMLNTYFGYTIPKDLRASSRVDEIINRTKSFYFGNNITNGSITDAVKYYTDIYYSLIAVQSTRRYARSGKRSPMFMYEFAYDGGMPYYKILLNITQIPGVCHADEIAYMFSPTGFDLKREDDKLLAKRLVKMWTNFAKYSDPTPHTSSLLPARWSPVTENLEYLLIDRTLQVYRKPFPDRIKYWDGVYENLLP